MKQIPVYTPFETGSFKKCGAFAWKYAEEEPWPVSIDFWWQRLDNKWMEVLSAVVVCAERHNKEYVSWQYSAYKILWRKKGFGMPLFVTLSFLKLKPLAILLLLWKMLQPLQSPEETCSSRCSRSLLNTLYFLLFNAFHAMLWHRVFDAVRPKS